MRVLFHVRFSVEQTFTVEKEAQSVEEAQSLLNFPTTDFDLSQLYLDATNFQIEGVEAFDE